MKRYGEKETICLIIVPLYLPNQTNINDDRSLHGQREREWGEWERVRERKESGMGVREWVGESKVKSERSDGESEERKWRERMR